MSLIKPDKRDQYSFHFIFYNTQVNQLFFHYTFYLGAFHLDGMMAGDKTISAPRFGRSEQYASRMTGGICFSDGASDLFPAVIPARAIRDGFSGIGNQASA